MTSSFLFKSSIVAVLVATIAVMSFSAAFAQEAIDNCAVRADVESDEVRQLTGGGQTSGVDAGTSLDLDGSNAGENALICTYSLIKFITNVAVAVIFIVSILIFLLAAYKFLTAGGGEGQKDARSLIVWGVVGLVVAFVAQNIPNIIRGLLGS